MQGAPPRSALRPGQQEATLDPAVVATVLGHANAAFTLSRYVGVRGDLSTTVTAATESW